MSMYQPVVVYCSLHTIIQTLFVSNNHIITRIIHFLNSNFLLCVIFLYGKKFVNIIWFCVPCALFSGQNSDAIYLAALTLGVKVILFLSEGAEV